MHASDRSDPRSINKALTSCRTAKDICAVCLDSIDKFNSINVSTALHRLAKCTQKPDRETIQIAQRICNRAMETLNDFDSRGIANLMWALATLGLAPGPELEAAMCRRATAISGEFNPQAVANLMWALAKLGLDISVDFLPVLSPRIVAHLRF